MRAQLKKHFAETLKKRLVIIGYFLAALFLTLNLVLSQIISPLYFQLLRPQRSTAVEFLKAVRPLSVFQEKLSFYQNAYDPSVKEEVFAEDKQRDELINRLEQVLSDNPSQRDILYSLFLLYSDKGDQNTADAFLRAAKAIDPNLR